MNLDRATDVATCPEQARERQVDVDGALTLARCFGKRLLRLDHVPVEGKLQCLAERTRRTGRWTARPPPRPAHALSLLRAGLFVGQRQGSQAVNLLFQPGDLASLGTHAEPQPQVGPGHEEPDHQPPGDKRAEKHTPDRNLCLGHEEVYHDRLRVPAHQEHNYRRNRNDDPENKKTSHGWLSSAKRGASSS